MLNKSQHIIIYSNKILKLTLEFQTLLQNLHVTHTHTHAHAHAHARAHIKKKCETGVKQLTCCAQVTKQSKIN